MKLQIGPGRAYFPGWENVDIFSNTKADMYSSALALPYPREYFGLIYASHVLEHINRHMIYSALTHWKDRLKVGGILRLSVPDFHAICSRYLSTRNIKEITGLLYGGQNNMLDNHHVAFDRNFLYECLEKVGFKDIREWDWRKTDHCNYDDYSQAYLPHMDKDNGLHMSLNLEATK